MIGGGTGIAPMLQVARDILKSSDDQVRNHYFSGLALDRSL